MGETPISPLSPSFSFLPAAVIETRIPPPPPLLPLVSLINVVKNFLSKLDNMGSLGSCPPPLPPPPSPCGEFTLLAAIDIPRGNNPPMERLGSNPEDNPRNKDRLDTPRSNSAGKSGISFGRPPLALGCRGNVAFFSGGV